MAQGEEVKVRVRLDTSQAKSSLRGLMQNVESTAGSVSAGIRRTVGRGLAAVGLGGLFGMGVAAIQGPIQAGAGDIISEALGGVAAFAERSVFGRYGPEARASARARQGIMPWARHIAISGEREGARQQYKELYRLYLPEEEGRQLIETDPKFRRGDIRNIGVDLGVKLGIEVFKAVDWLKAQGIKLFR